MPNFDAAEAEIERWRAITGKPDFSAIEFTINGSKFPIGDFINALIGDDASIVLPFAFSYSETSFWTAISSS